MEIKVNKEIRDYSEAIFFGLSMRQFIFSALACIVALLLYFLLRDHLGTEILSWICIFGAIPFAALGFVKYNGMNAEEFFVAWIKSEILMPRVLYFKPTNYYDELLKDEFKRMEMEEKKSENTRITKKTKNKQRKV